MSDTIEAAATAIADPTRRHLMQRLAQGPGTAGQLAALFSTSRPAVSRHLRVLREVGMVRAIDSGRHIWFEALDGPLAGLESWVRDLRKRIADAPVLEMSTSMKPPRSRS